MKIAVITGASSGLGMEYARTVTQLYPHLDEIWLIARRRERLEKENANIKILVNIAGFERLGNMDTEMNPKGGTSQSDKVDKLPFLDMKKITRKSIILAPKGQSNIYAGYTIQGI